MQSKGLPRVFSNTTVRKRPSLGAFLLCSSALTLVHDHWKDLALGQRLTGSRAQAGTRIQGFSPVCELFRACGLGFGCWCPVKSVKSTWAEAILGRFLEETGCVLESLRPLHANAL